GLAMGSAMAVGQILGGYLVTADFGGLSWRIAFLLNIPVGLIGLLAARRVVPESHSPQVARQDIRRAALLALAVILLLFPLTLGRQVHWALWTIIMMVASVPAGTLFILAQRRTERAGGMPLLPLSLLHSASMRRGLIAAMVFLAGFAAMLLTTT